MVPSPTMSEVPHAFAPRTFASQRPLHPACAFEPVSCAYSLAMTARPVPWVAVSHVDQGNPNWNGSVEARAIAASSAFFRSATSAAWVVSSPGGSPAWPIARWSS